MSWGFGAWLYTSEIMPQRLRGRTIGLCTGVYWLSNVLNDFITPLMISGPGGPGGTLLFFGFMSLLVVVFTILCLPETGGRSLEEIAPMFRFEGWAEFKQFMRGNVWSGDGMLGVRPPTIKHVS